MASPNDTVVTGTGASITDASGNVWTINADGRIAVNGVADPTTAQVDELAYSSGLIWQKNVDNHWYSKTSPADTWAFWANPAPPVSIPGASSNNATIVAGSAGRLVDANGNTWSLIRTTAATGYQVAVDGAVDPTTANVVQMAIVNGTIWQENAAALWYAKTTPATPWSAPTTVDPMTGAAEPISSTWIGGGDNRASDPADWSSAAVPAAGVRLFMASGTMNLAGNALAGDTLDITPGATATIDVTGKATLKLATTQPSAAIAVNLAAGSTLTLNAEIVSSTLNITGGTLTFTGSNTFHAFRTVLSDNVIGTGSVNLRGGNATGEFMEINGSVGSGLRFDISAPGPDDAGLQIDRPAAFAGAVTLQSGFLAFMGLQATSAEILNGVLELLNGSTLVSATRFANRPDDSSGPLQIEQNGLGVMVSTGLGSHYQPGGVGTVLPLTT